MTNNKLKTLNSSLYLDIKIDFCYLYCVCEQKNNKHWIE